VMCDAGFADAKDLEAPRKCTYLCMEVGLWSQLVDIRRRTEWLLHTCKGKKTDVIIRGVHYTVEGRLLFEFKDVILCSS
jgi:hypothetical protein